VSGVIEEIGFAPGATVAEGQTLFVIEDDLYEASAREAQGALRAAEAAISPYALPALWAGGTLRAQWLVAVGGARSVAAAVLCAAVLRAVFKTALHSAGCKCADCHHQTLHGQLGLPGGSSAAGGGVSGLLGAALLCDLGREGAAKKSGQSSDDGNLCAVCYEGAKTNNALNVCDECGTGYHTKCIGVGHKPVKAEEWTCEACQRKQDSLWLDDISDSDSSSSSSIEEIDSEPAAEWDCKKADRATRAKAAASRAGGRGGGSKPAAKAKLKKQATAADWDADDVNAYEEHPVPTAGRKRGRGAPRPRQSRS
jgi:pyruvate/2-oxoglutarate dehydrogenase complex dihydrolipoamide acyltransferase (E2) component